LLVSLGHDCFGLDATPEFVEISQKIHPQLKGKIVQGALPTFVPPFGGQFDGILCSAVLMHVSEEQLITVAVSIKGGLKQNGRFLYSVTCKRLDVVTKNRDANGGCSFLSNRIGCK